MEACRETNKESLLVCLSPSPSNGNIIEKAAKMAAAFDASFTALYVQPPNYERMKDADRNRLRMNIQLAEKLGASIITVEGDDTATQIAEYARVSGITKIVVGKSIGNKGLLSMQKNLTEQLVLTAPNVEIYIIPDSFNNIKVLSDNISNGLTTPLEWKDLAITGLILMAATVIGLGFLRLGFSESTIITVYLLCVLIDSILTKSYLCSVIVSLGSVLLLNYYFTEPLYTFHVYEAENLATFATLLIASLITGTLANRLKANARQSARSAFRTKVLFDTSQMLQKAQQDDEVLNITANQVLLLLGRNIIIYPVKNGHLDVGIVFQAEEDKTGTTFLKKEEREAAEWVFAHKKRAGNHTERFPDTEALYLAIYIGDRIYGVLGVHVSDRALDSFEYSILLSILGECALALDDLHNAVERKQAETLAEKEKLRANLLRTISHDLRTPLTSISGNAGNLLSNYGLIDDETRTRMFEDIYEDSQWLISLVENLLSVTRLEDGQMQLKTSVQLLDEVIEAALSHVDRNRIHHNLITEYPDEMLLSNVDARLIMQVIINIVNNAIKYTPDGSDIRIIAGSRGDRNFISIYDNGPGLSEETRAHVFDMFYTGQNSNLDGRRSLGLGLGLCKSIIEAHGGEIYVTDNTPTGCVFTFTLPKTEIDVGELYE